MTGYGLNTRQGAHPIALATCDRNPVLLLPLKSSLISLLDHPRERRLPRLVTSAVGAYYKKSAITSSQSPAVICVANEE